MASSSSIHMNGNGGHGNGHGHIGYGHEIPRPSTPSPSSLSSITDDHRIHGDEKKSNIRPSITYVTNGSSGAMGNGHHYNGSIIKTKSTTDQDLMKEKQLREEHYKKQATDELIDLCLLGFSVVGPMVYLYIVMMASQPTRTVTALTIFMLMLFNMACNVVLSATKQHSLSNPIRARLTIARFFVNDTIGTLMVYYDRYNVDSAWWLFCFFNIVGGSLDFSTARGSMINDIIHVFVGSWWCWLSGRSLAACSSTAMTLSLVGVFFTGAAVTLRTTRVEMHTSVDRKKLYLAHIAHELRTPLTGILGISSLLKEELTSTSIVSPIPPSVPSISSNNSSPFFARRPVTIPIPLPPVPLTPITLGVTGGSMNNNNNNNNGMVSSSLSSASAPSLSSTPSIQIPAPTTTNNNGRIQTFVTLTGDSPVGTPTAASLASASSAALPPSYSSMAAASSSSNTSSSSASSSSSSSSAAANSEVVAMVNTLSICTDSLLQVANAVLDISKIEANALKLRSDPLDLRVVVEEVTELARASAIQLKKDVFISCDVSALSCPSNTHGSNGNNGNGNGMVSPSSASTGASASSLSSLTSLLNTIPAVVASTTGALPSLTAAVTNTNGNGSGNVVSSPLSNVAAAAVAVMAAPAARVRGFLSAAATIAPMMIESAITPASLASSTTTPAPSSSTSSPATTTTSTTTTTIGSSSSSSSSSRISMARMGLASPMSSSIVSSSLHDAIAPVTSSLLSPVASTVSTTTSPPTLTPREHSLQPQRPPCIYTDSQGRCCSGAHILSDGQRIRQLLINLMNNAVKFTSEGSVTLSVQRMGGRSPRNSPTASPGSPAVTTPQRYMFCVTDTGAGVPEHLRESIFEPFMQGPQGGNGQAGTGLGLYISRRLAETFGGTVYCKPNTGAVTGSIFCLELNLTPRTDCYQHTSYHCTPWTPTQSFSISSPSTINRSIGNTSSGIAAAVAMHAAAKRGLHTHTASSRSGSPAFGPSISGANSSTSSPMMTPIMTGSPAAMENNSDHSSGSDDMTNGHHHHHHHPQHHHSSSLSVPMNLRSVRSPSSIESSESDNILTSPNSNPIGLNATVDTTSSSSSSGVIPRGSYSARASHPRRIRLTTVHPSSSSDRLNRFQCMDSTIMTSANGNGHGNGNGNNANNNHYYDETNSSGAIATEVSNEGDIGDMSSDMYNEVSDVSDVDNQQHMRRRASRRSDAMAAMMGNSSDASASSSGGSSSNNNNNNGNGGNGNATATLVASSAPTSHALMRAAALRRFHQNVASTTNGHSSPKRSGSPSPSPEPPVARSASNSVSSVVSSTATPPVTVLTTHDGITLTNNTNSSSDTPSPMASSDSPFASPSSSPSHSPSAAGLHHGGLQGGAFFPSSSSSAPASTMTSAPGSINSTPMMMSPSTSPSNLIIDGPAVASSSSNGAGAATVTAGTAPVVGAPPVSNRVLLVEDVAINRAVLARMLQKLGLPADEAANGREAVDMAMIRQYDFILMDCQMPIMDGYAATEYIRNNMGPNQHSRIIALTASALPGDREKCLRSGMSEYVTKPVSYATLKTLLSDR